MEARSERIDLPDISIAWEETGPPSAPPVLLLHGFPDEVRAWDGVIPGLAAAGYRTVAPWLRGYGETRSTHEATTDDGALAVMVHDLTRLVDALGVGPVPVVAHDRGARIAQATAILAPGRIDRLVSLSRYAVAFGGGSSGPPPWATLRALWYQWVLALDVGESILGADPRAFARQLWREWSPGWTPPAGAFAATAPAFANPDFVPVVLGFYREPHAPATLPPDRADEAHRLAERPAVPVPTLPVHGEQDGVDLLETLTDESALFPGGYRQIVPPGVGHFPHRERADEIVRLALEWLTPGRR